MADLTIIRDIVQTKPGTRIRPREFFIARQGVAALAYQGFSHTLLEIKEEIGELVPGLKPENPGSRWPKTTLGALKDDVTLTRRDADELRRICTDLQPEIDGEDTAFELDGLSVVLFSCRSLERRLETCKIELDPELPVDDRPPPGHHLSRVEDIMAQFSPDRLPEYLPDLQRAGNRESDYRGDCIEAALVFDLSKEKPAYIQRFKTAVEKNLPGRYAWFEPDSYHMTVRALA